VRHLCSGERCKLSDKATEERIEWLPGFRLSWSGSEMGEFAQTLHSGPMTVMLCCICNDHTDSLYVWRLKEPQQHMLVTDT